VTPTRTTAQWLEVLRSRDVPCASVNSIDDLLKDPHLNDIGFFRTMKHPTEGALRSTRSPFHVHGIPEQQDLPAPNVSADAKAILREAGFAAERIEALAAAGVIKL